MNATPPTTSRAHQPRQGGLVVLLCAMMMVNLSVLVVVLADRWFSKPEVIDRGAVAQADTTPTDGTGHGTTRGAAPAASSDAPQHTTDRSDSMTAEADAPQPTPSPAAETDPDAPDRLADRSPAADSPASEAPQTEPTSTRPPLEFFGIPLFE